MNLAFAPSARDYRGHGDKPPAVRWPNGARLALSIVVNFEEGAELSLSRGDERNEYVYEIVERIDGVPDACMESHFAYGTRAGWPRIRALLKRYGVKATINACGRAVATSPWLAAEAAADGHEVCSHGWRWERQANMPEAHEREVIRKSVEAIAAATGTPPVGWHTRSSTSPNTRRLLVEHGGFLYDSNEYDDDLPRVETVLGRPHVVLPYAFDSNDMRFASPQGFNSGDQFFTYLKDSFDVLYREGEERPRMMSIGMHCRLLGRPGRTAALERFIDYVAGHDAVWCARRIDIARHWIATHPFRG